MKNTHFIFYQRRAAECNTKIPCFGEDIFDFTSLLCYPIIKKVIPVCRNILYAFAEPNYVSSVWFAKTLSGLQDTAARLRIEVRLMSRVGELPALRPAAAALISDKTEWVQYMVYELGRMGIKPILVGAAPTGHGSHISGPILDRQTLVAHTVQYFISAGRHRLASVGNDPRDTNDMARMRYFLEAVHDMGCSASERDVYTVKSNLEQCIKEFLDHAGGYDGAICVNDYVAVQLLVAADKRGIRIPEQLFVAGSGNMIIGSCTTPTLTTSTLNYYEMGCQAVHIWNYLQQHTEVSDVHVSIPCELICRQSTASLPPPAYPANFSGQVETPGNTLEAADLQLRRLENCLIHCDSLDFGILCCVLENLSGEKIAERLFISQGTVQYRLKKLYQRAGVSSRRGFETLLKLYITNTDFLVGLLSDQ